MSDRNPARELADSGTPGPWNVDIQWPADIQSVNGRMTATTGGMANGRSNAAKIVRAVNALPAIADLLDAIREHRVGATIYGTTECDCSRASDDGQCPTVDAAADAVEAALRGEA